MTNETGETGETTVEPTAKQYLIDRAAALGISMAAVGAVAASNFGVDAYVSAPIAVALAAWAAIIALMRFDEWAWVRDRIGLEGTYE